MELYTLLAATIKRISQEEITLERKSILNVLIDSIQQKLNNREEINLNFICTHNARRSQFSQLWAQTAAHFYGIEANCFSGGVEESAFNERAVASCRRAGFKISSQGEFNPHYSVSFAEDAEPLMMFSKLYNHPSNPVSEFIAVMTCSNADETCPFILGAKNRISLLYEDPKEFDESPEEATRYDERSIQIASELFYAFSNVSNK